MKLGVFTAILDHQPLETALDYLQGLGVQAVELGCGGTAGHSHANPEILLNDAGALREFQRLKLSWQSGPSQSGDGPGL